MWKHRYSVLGALSVAYMLCYVARMTMASAAPFIAAEFHLSALQVGAVLSAFFFGYALLQIPGGLLVDKIGPGRVLVASISAWSLCSGLTGMVTSLSALLIIRVLFGASEAAFPAAASKTLALWFGDREIGRANGLMLASTQIGASVAPSLVALLVLSSGWRAAFYWLVLPGALLSLVVAMRIADSPAHAADISRKERGIRTRQSLAAVQTIDLLRTLRRPAVGWCVAAAFFSNLASWGLMNWLPTYLLQAHGLSTSQMGLMASLPALSGALGYALGGQISDRWFRTRRQTPVVLGLASSGACVFFAASAGSAGSAVAWLGAAFFFLLIADLGVCTLPMAIVPHSAIGSAFGLINSAAQVAGFLSPLLVGFVLNAYGNDFTLVFHGFVACLLIAAIAAACVRQGADAPTESSGAQGAAAVRDR